MRERERERETVRVCVCLYGPPYWNPYYIKLWLNEECSMKNLKVFFL